ncbi:TonB-dependent receptor [Chitinophaga horti]|uniref:TonB-dependent receptor n=1 Tax=Chitinophaga horti TaxID=2920382 RepID=A0ABY6IWW8_9BACT|nr:TonB-dependent receptor [Chitinophaga horti]UYQ91738.1 TonB-dependent receptor [Chitinophaga horti]
MKSRLLVAAALSVPAMALAQENQKQLDPVTVTATIQPTTSSRTGRNLVIIKGEDIAKLPVNSIDELLRYVPGLEVQARGPMGAQSDIMVRGGTFQQVLVIIDGMRVNDPNTGHFNSYIPVTPGEIERIEVLKGASSAIYGSEAVGGVIHIITKAFAAGAKAQQSYNASATGGAYGLWNLGGSAYYNTGKTAFTAGVLSNNTDGQQQRGTKGFLHLNTFSLAASHRLNDRWQLALRSSYDTRNFGAQGFYTTAASDTARENVNSWWNQLQVRYEHGKNKFSFLAGYKSVTDTYRFNGLGAANSSDSKLFQSLAVYEHAFTEKTALTGGLQFQDKSISSNDRGDHNLQQAAAFVGLNQRIGDRFLINPALRLDWNEQSGYELVPQLNVSYRAEWVQLRASAGKTIRDADFTERYNNYEKALVTNGQRVGNPNLAAEHSFSYEAGADFFIHDRIRISSTVFRREQEDVIDWTNTPYANMPRKDNLSSTASYALAKNIAEVNTTGFETDVQYIQPLANQHKIVLNAGVVWMDTQTPNGTASFYIASNARLLTNFTVQYAAPRWNLAINGLYKERNAQSATAIKAFVDKSYFLINAKAEYYVVKNRVAVFAQADNIFDKSYQDLLGAQMPGLWLMGGAKFTLNK